MKRAGRIAAALLAAALLTACGSQQKIALRVNNDTVTEDEFYHVAADVDAVDLRPVLMGQPGAAHAGEFAVAQLIGEKVLMQIAKDKKVAPTDAQINAYLAFAKKYTQASGIAPDPWRSDDSWRRNARVAVAYRNLLLQSVPVAPADLQKLYDQLRPRLKEPDTYHLRVVDCSTPAKAEEALAALKKGVPFETVALTKSEDRVSAGRSGDIGTVPESSIPQPMLQAIQKLKPNEYTQTPIKTIPPTGPNSPPGAAAEPHYVIVRMEAHTPGRTPSLEEVKPLLENLEMQQKDPTASNRIQTMVHDYEQKADIQVNLKQYQDLVKRMKQPLPATPGPGVGAPPIPSTPAPAPTKTGP